MRKACVIVFCLMLSVHLWSQNPIVPPGMYIADPEAHVWSDGRLYVYGSRDESPDYWCSYAHHVLSTKDLKHWDIEENVFSSKGEHDAIDYSDKLLFAPDCAEKNGMYYLYYCSPGKELTEGVARSRSPYGPFVGGTEIKGAYQIDPAVFVDDDGQGYYFWGQGKPKAARLSGDMMSIDTTTITFPLQQTAIKVFHEGSSIRKIGKTYYLVFADESRNKTPSCLGYATSDSPMGPYTYQGVIIDNIACDPHVWNNHGSIESFNGQWYVFYHRSTHGSKLFRKACVEPITINPDGTIDEVEMTSQGAGSPLDALGQIQAEWACSLEGNVRVEDFKQRDLWYGKLAQIQAEDCVGFKYVDFKDGASSFLIKILASNAKGRVEIYLDDPVTGLKIGECSVALFNDKQAYVISSGDIKHCTGIHAVYLKFKGAKEMLLAMDWFQFQN